MPQHWRVILLLSLVSGVAYLVRADVHRFWRILGIVMSVCLALYALPVLAAHWLLFLAFPFISFTFTDPPDFIFAGLIVFTLTALVVRHRRRPYPPGWVKTASAAAVVLAVVAPLTPMAALYLLAYRGQDLIGHWPQPMSDDPKYIGLDDPTYQTFRAAVIYGSCFAGWGLYTWGALLVHLRRNLTTRRVLWLIGIFLLAWLLFVVDPGRRFEWWLD